MRTGRPREFDVNLALERAMHVFWKKGYEGASLPDLTEAMGINRPSLYAAFGNKQALFRKAVDRYSGTNGPAAPLLAAIEQPTAYAVARHLLQSTVDMLTCPNNPRGCFLIQGALACSAEAEPIKKELIRRRRKAESMIRRRLALAIDAGDLPKGTDPAELAAYLATVTSGMSVQASAGATRAELLSVVNRALSAWPTHGVL